MNHNQDWKRRPKLRRYLLTWFSVCAIVMVFTYTQLLEYYLEIGIHLRTQTFLEQTADTYVDALIREESPVPPTGPNLAGYLSLEEIPAHILTLFDRDDIIHGEALRVVNVDLNEDDEREFIHDTGNLCDNSPCDLVFLYAHELGNGDQLYLVHGVLGNDQVYDALELTEQLSFGIGVLFLTIFLLVSLVGIRSIDGPLRRFDIWSRTLTQEGTNNEIPDLRFRELYRLANRLLYAHERMREGVEKEKQFLRHASHELRTPIAILAANAELIEKLSDREDRTDAESAAFVRQSRAIDDVRLLIETLLWINRQSETEPKMEEINLRSELDDIASQYHYLIDSRPVTLNVSGDAEAFSAPGTPARIVLSNLLRNAFQHTHEGEISITVDSNQVTINNPTTGESVDTTDGFGLGLELVAQLCERFDWQIEMTEERELRTTTLRF